MIGRQISLLPESNTKFPASVMVLWVISSKGDVMPHPIFEKGQRVNAKQYIEILDTTVKPWMVTIAGECPYMFQQDRVSAYTAKIPQDWLKANLKDHCTLVEGNLASQLIRL
jgi:hypothetical protein